MTIRELTETEKQALLPDLRAYVAGLEAQERLQRMTVLLSGGDPNIYLDLKTMSLIRDDEAETEDE